MGFDINKFTDTVFSGPCQFIGFIILLIIVGGVLITITEMICNLIKDIFTNHKKTRSFQSIDDKHNGR